jgi:7-cyano-7-deazaguanine synthase in queuosine biosynthesis
MPITIGGKYYPHYDSLPARATVTANRNAYMTLMKAWAAKRTNLPALVAGASERDVKYDRTGNV